MAAFIALWPKPDRTEDFEAHYRDTHLPIVREYPEATSVVTKRVTGTPRGEDGPFHLVTVAEFDSRDALTAALRSDAGSRSADDAREIAREYGIVPVLLLAEDFS